MTRRGANEGVLPWLEAWRKWTNIVIDAGAGAAAGKAGLHASAAGGFARAYIDFSNVLIKLLDDANPTDLASKLLDALARSNGGRGSPGDAIINAFIAAAPATMLGLLPNANVAQSWQQWITTLGDWSNELLALPALGPTREWSGKIAAIQRAVLAEREAAIVISSHYRTAFEAGLRGLAVHLSDHSGPPITTVRGVYDAWVTQAEGAYRAQVMAVEFSRDFAQWVNAGSALRLAVRGLGERLGALFDLPQRSEIDILLQRHQALRAEFLASRSERAADKQAVEPVVSSECVGTPSRPAPAPGILPGTSGRPGRRQRPQPQQSGSTPRRQDAVIAIVKPKPKPKAKPKSIGDEFDIGRILGTED